MLVKLAKQRGVTLLNVVRRADQALTLTLNPNPNPNPNPKP